VWIFWIQEELKDVGQDGILKKHISHEVRMLKAMDITT
jgi:hypothetical protein